MTRSPEKTNMISDHNIKMVDIHPNAQIGKDVIVSSFTVIEEDVTIGPGTWIGPHVTIMSGTRIGANCKIFPGAVIGAVPQDLKFEGEYTTLEIGDNVTVREYCTLNRGTNANGKTVIGANSLLMAYVHVAHDCIVGQHVILGNGVNMAGHVTIADHAIISGLSAIHQFVKIGAHVMVTGGSLIRTDVPPFTKCAREPLAYVGVNTVGLHRRGFAQEDIEIIQKIYRYLFVKGYNRSQAIELITNEVKDNKYKTEILDFLALSERGIIKGFQPNPDDE